MRVASKANVYFRHDCWNHRYVKIREDGSKEYGTITGFDSFDSANESFWDYLDDYYSKNEELNRIEDSKEELGDDIEQS